MNNRPPFCAKYNIILPVQEEKLAFTKDAGLVFHAPASGQDVLRFQE